MSILRENPELKSLFKSVKNHELQLSNIVLRKIYRICIQYAPPQRCKTFIENLFSSTPIHFCTECGYPKTHSSCTIVYRADNVCSNCLSIYYLRDSNGYYQHRLDYDADSPETSGLRIANLSEYNSRVGNVKRQTRKELTLINKQKYDNLPYLGIELEAEIRSNCPVDSIVSQILNKLPDFVICKYDSSLHNGLEVVSIPATFDVHKSGVWEPFFQENDGPAKYLRAWRSDTAGCHIHISRASLTPLHMVKFILFINGSDNGVFVEKFAGRRSDRWAKRSDKKPGDVYKRTDKYEAVNFSRSGPTLELRIFRGNVSKHGVYRNLEFVQAVYKFTLNTSLKKLKYTEFCAWLQDKTNQKLYPYLYNWCINNDYIRGKPISTIIKDTTKGT